VTTGVGDGLVLVPLAADPKGNEAPQLIEAKKKHSAERAQGQLERRLSGEPCDAIPSRHALAEGVNESDARIPLTS
jgi:hypothetical protein